MLDYTVHLGDLLVAAGFALGGWRLAVAHRDQIRGLHQTVYGSLEPPVEGLVSIAKRHEKIIGKFAPIIDGSRHDGPLV